MDGAGVTDDEIHKITWENTCRLFGYDPFEHISREDGNGRRAAGAVTRRRHRDPVAGRVARALRERARGLELGVGDPHHDPADGLAPFHRVQRRGKLGERHVEADERPHRAACEEVDDLRVQTLGVGV